MGLRAAVGAVATRISDADVGVEITRVTEEMPSCEDIDRLQHRLDAMGRTGG